MSSYTVGHGENKHFASECQTFAVGNINSTIQIRQDNFLVTSSFTKSKSNLQSYNAQQPRAV